jgi:hypothetical protein
MTRVNAAGPGTGSAVAHSAPCEAAATTDGPETGSGVARVVARVMPVAEKETNR